MLFAKGNKAASKPSKKAAAEIILQRIKKEGANLPITQLTALVRESNRLTVKRRRRHRKEPKAEKVTDNFGLSAEQAEIHRMIMQIEAERLEAAREKWRREWEASRKEQKPTPPEPIEPATSAAPSRTAWTLRADV